jgi:hypothetical protein
MAKKDTQMTVGDRLIFEEAMAQRGWVKSLNKTWEYDGDFHDTISDEAARRHWLKWGGACEPVPF